MDLSWHALNSGQKVKTLKHAEKQGFCYPRLSKTHWSWAQFQKGQPTQPKFPFWIRTVMDVNQIFLQICTGMALESVSDIWGRSMIRFFDTW